MDTIKCELFLAAIDRGSLTAAGEAFGYGYTIFSAARPYPRPSAQDCWIRPFPGRYTPMC